MDSEVNVRLNSVRWLCALASLSFGFDLQDPVKKGEVEVGAGYGHERLLGLYDPDGEFHSWDEIGFPDDFDPRAHLIPLRLKYGLGSGMDLEFELDIASTNNDAGDASGLTQPNIGFKYLHPWGLGFFADVALPFATGDFGDRDLSTILEAGILARKRLGAFRISGLVSYVNDFEDNDGSHILLRPEFLLEDKHGIFLDLETVAAEDDAGNEASVFLLSPGVRAEVTDKFAIEMNYRRTVAGESSPAMSQIRIMAYMKMKP